MKHTEKIAILLLLLLLLLFLIAAAPQCSTVCNDNADCTTAFCLKNQGECEGEGICAEKPEDCDAEYAPVCGCDQEEYPNDCHAFQSGVNVLAPDICENILCPEEDCGPQLGMPNYPCTDKTTGGPTGRCLKLDNDTCGWEIRDCEIFLPGQGEECGNGDVCQDGFKCIHYYGIAGGQGLEFTSCEIPCLEDIDCPDDQVCVLIADGPGNVCRP